MQEIEKRFPNAIVYTKPHTIKQGLKYVNTKVDLRFKDISFLSKFASKLHIVGLCKKLHLPYEIFLDGKIIKDADYFIDGSGFAFSDQWTIDQCGINLWERILKKYKEQRTKIIFLPQAFGPAQKKNTRKILSIISKYADMVMPREIISKQYIESCTVDTKNIYLYPDFTSLVEGVFPSQYSHLKGAVCIIPNKRMIDKGVLSKEQYLEFIKTISLHILQEGKSLYLLNHEGNRDKEFAQECKNYISQWEETSKLNAYKVDVVSGLNALEIKGLISTSYICISSRFHGVASTLNSCVPSLATSWSHKYEELYKDYNQKNCVLNMKDTESCLQKIHEFLMPEKNTEIRAVLYAQKKTQQETSKRMWEQIFKNNS